LDLDVRGFDLNLIPQQGHVFVAQIIKIEHVRQRFRPLSYRSSPVRNNAL